MTYEQVFLTKFREAGNNGVPNYELSKISLQYNATIFGLRKRGYDIRKRKISKGTYIYYLVTEPDKPVAQAPAAAPEVKQETMFTQEEVPKKRNYFI